MSLAAAQRRRPRLGGVATEPWQALAALTEPRRREVYEYVAAPEEPVTRDDVSQALGMTRSLAVFHLDKLAAAGLLDVTFARPAGRKPGPGAGRPNKRYAPSDAEIDLSVPPRRYDIAGRIMARAIASNRRPQDPATTARRIAREDGRALGRNYAAQGATSVGKTLAATEQALASCGYAPAAEGSSIRLRNCPFHSLVEVAPALVCELNESFIGGILTGIGGDPSVTAQLCDTREGDCCVVVQAARRRG